MVINLTIEHNPQRFIPIAHRLSRGRRKIDDGKAAVGQTHAAVRGNPNPGAVRTTMNHRIPHADQIRRRHFEVAAFERQYASNSAHREVPSLYANTSIRLELWRGLRGILPAATMISPTQTPPRW